MAKSDALRQPASPQVEALFDRVAPVYDELNQTLSLGLHRIWKRMAVLWSEAQTGDRVLDICCGSGDVALLLAQQVGAAGQVEGLDFSHQQLAVARQRPQPDNITWVEGNALDLPYAEGSFDAATMSYGLRNLSDIPRALAELRRVLKPDKKAAILDFHRPRSIPMQQFQRWYLHQVVVPTAERLGLRDEYAYLEPSIARFPQGPQQVRLAIAAGFSHAVHYPIAAGMMGVLVVKH
ncbi:bifunctional demethylmenaquinone methyltransferase/2-methoxy-6-polyprenyl-1,4-benzoquinol methylase UbiE [filamentous cyanobacterium CCP5]|nr:bifunctional demethylmenaquinone methyltransferase/2-methoxy-6-polyprenyl-1,4-benzoquinol methylase UbiE [filamentous cyanobacterium CCP5]